MIAAILGSRIGRWLSAAGAVLLAILGAWFVGRREGRKAEEAAASKEALERTAAAARARANVRPGDQAAMDADEFNKDRRGP